MIPSQPNAPVAETPAPPPEDDTDEGFFAKRLAGKTGPEKEPESEKAGPAYQGATVIDAQTGMLELRIVF